MRYQQGYRTYIALGALVTGVWMTMWGAGYAAGQTSSAPVRAKDVIAHYATIVSASYEDAYTRALALQEAVRVFVARPSPAALEAAKNAWKRARIPYGQTEVYRFSAGPIDADGLEGQINAWPLDESYIDYVADQPQAGLINRPDIPITTEGLRALNEEGGETNISTGYHAIEFLLWGQDLSPDGPGARPYTDYMPQTNGTAANPQRRSHYLLTVIELLVEDLQQLVQAWAPHRSDNYRATFVQGNPHEALRKILTGMGTLSRGELAGERLAVALATRDQEDEHSCFSDNTHVDVIFNAIGMQNVYLGRYIRTDGTVLDGPGLKDLVSPDLQAKMARQLATTLVKVHSIAPPFDHEIVTADGRQRVQEAIVALRAQAELIMAIARELGITNLQVELPQ
jgi:putative iron-regulated protein